MKSCSHSQKMGHGKGKSSNRQIMKIFMRHGILNNVSATKVLHSLMTHLNYLCLWHLNCLYQSFVILPPLHKIHAQNALKKKKKKKLTGYTETLNRKCDKKASFKWENDTLFSTFSSGLPDVPEIVLPDGSLF